MRARTNRQVKTNTFSFASLAQSFLSLVCLQANEEGQSSESVCCKRLGFSFIVLLTLNVLLVSRLFNLQGRDHKQWMLKAQKQHSTALEIAGSRGSITDARGRALAVSLPTLAVGIHPNKVKNIEETSLKLAQILKQSPEEIKAKLDPNKKFIWLARGVERSSRKLLKSLKLAELEMYDDFTRHNPQGEVALQLVGKVGRDGKGLSGVEAQFDQILKGTVYQMPTGRDAKGRFLNEKLFSKINYQPEGENLSSSRQEGSELKLTIDSYIQGIVESEMQRGRVEAKAKRVFGLVMDAETGEVLALANNTEVNKNDKFSPEKLRVVVAQDSFEPGSTFKPLVATLALDAGVIKEDEIMDCGSGLGNFGSYRVRDVHPIGVVPLPQVLIQSSNVCMAKIANRLGKERLYNSIVDMGFGAKTGIELSGEAKGILRNYKEWRPVTVATHGFGQGIAVTAIQLTRAYSALLNGGFLPKVSLVKNEKLVREQIFSSANSKKVLEMIKGVTEDTHGTGRPAKISGLTVYGKTGTAQQPYLNGRGYDPNRILASFIGGIDGAEIGLNRKLVMFVAVDEPGVRPRWGGRLAGPVFRRSLERILSYMLSSDRPSLQAKSILEDDLTSAKI